MILLILVLATSGCYGSKIHQTIQEHRLLANQVILYQDPIHLTCPLNGSIAWYFRSIYSADGAVLSRQNILKYEIPKNQISRFKISSNTKHLTALQADLNLSGDYACATMDRIIFGKLNVIRSDSTCMAAADGSYFHCKIVHQGQLSLTLRWSVEADVGIQNNKLKINSTLRDLAYDHCSVREWRCAQAMLGRSLMSGMNFTKLNIICIFEVKDDSLDDSADLNPVLYKTWGFELNKSIVLAPIVDVAPSGVSRGAGIYVVFSILVILVLSGVYQLISTVLRVRKEKKTQVRVSINTMTIDERKPSDAVEDLMTKRNEKAINDECKLDNDVSHPLQRSRLQRNPVNIYEGVSMPEAIPLSSPDKRHLSSLRSSLRVNDYGLYKLHAPVKLSTPDAR